MTTPIVPLDRLYLALYTRDNFIPSLLESDDRYHWALLLVPSIIDNLVKPNQATRFHIRNYHSGPHHTNWLYEEIGVDATGTPKLLTQNLIGDVVDVEGLLELIRDLPIVQTTEGWDCVGWLRSALNAIEEDGHVISVASGEASWERLRKLALLAADTESERRSPKVEQTEPFVWEL
jgi:hypothetical protein